MKIIFLIFALLGAMLVRVDLSAQDKIDRLTDHIAELAKQQAKLADKIDKISEQIAENNKQIAVTNVEVKALDKRMDIFFGLIIASSSILFAGIFGLIGSFSGIGKRTQSFEAKTEALKAENVELKKEISLLRKRELKHEEKTSNYFKKIAEIDPRFAAIA